MAAPAAATAPVFAVALTPKDEQAASRHAAQAKALAAASAPASGSSDPVAALRAALGSDAEATQAWLGESKEEHALIDSWLSFEISKTGEDLERVAATLAAHFQRHAFLSQTHRPAAADVVVFQRVRDVVRGKEADISARFPAFSRWLRHMETLLALEGQPLTFAAPPSVKPRLAADVKPAEPQAAAAPAAPAGKPAKQGKEKPAAPAAANSAESNASKPAASAPAAAAAPAGPPTANPNLLDIRVGKILTCRRHPDADTLYVEEIDLGEATGPRTICSGLVKYYADASLIAGKTCLVVANLKPRNMKGIESNGMVLAASDETKSRVELVVPPADSKPGDRVSYEGEFASFPGPAPEPVAPNVVAKKKVAEGVLPYLATDAEARVVWLDKGKPHVMRVGESPCVGGTIKSGTVS